MTSIKYLVIFDGTNNIDFNAPSNIAKTLIETGLMLLEKNKNSRVLISGLIPRDEKRVFTVLKSKSVM